MRQEVEMKSGMWLWVALASLVSYGCGRETAAMASAGRSSAEAVAPPREAYVGVVKEYHTGRRLMIEASDGRQFTFDLDERGVQVSMPPMLTPGASSEVVIERPRNEAKRIRVALRAE
jgi:hypothetical protein